MATVGSIGVPWLGHGREVPTGPRVLKDRGTLTQKALVLWAWVWHSMGAHPAVLEPMQYPGAPRPLKAQGGLL